MIHKIKLNKEFCDAVLERRKTFEIRFNDRGYQTGDFIKFIPISDAFPGPHETTHPIKNKTYKIIYILNGWGLQDGYVAMSIQEVEE